MKNSTCNSSNSLSNTNHHHQHNIKECPFINQSFIIISNDLRVLRISHLAKGLLRYFPASDLLDTPLYLDNLLKIKKSFKKEESSQFLNILAKTREGESLTLTTCLHPLSNSATLWFLVPQSKLMSIDRSHSPLPVEISQLLYTFNPSLAIKLTPHGLIRSINTDDSPLIPVYLPKVQLLPIFELIHPSDTKQFCKFLSSSLKTELNIKFKLRWILFDWDHRYIQRYIDCSVSEDGSVTKVSYGCDEDCETIGDNFDYEVESDSTEDYNDYEYSESSKKLIKQKNYYELEWVQITCRPSEDGGELTLFVEPSTAPTQSSLTRSPHIIIQLVELFTQYVKRAFSIFKYIPLERITLLKALVSILGLLCQLDYFINTKDLKLWYSAPISTLQSITPSRCYEMGQISLNQRTSISGQIENSSFWPILGLVVQLAIFKLPQAIWTKFKLWIL